MNVAQLKPAAEAAGDDAARVFPRLNESGSIEASSRRCSGRRQTPFPRLNERGSIEAVRVATNATGLSGFPRLNERGSIEAPARRRPTPRPRPSFPRLNERGSIEAPSG